MIKRISDYFLHIANLKTLAVATAVYLVFAAYVMPQGAKRFEEINGTKVSILDLQFSYNPVQAKAILANYNAEGRSYAIKFGLIADTFYPMAYTFLFSIITTLIFKRLSRYEVRTGYLHLFPLLILPVDYGENTGIVTLMKKYPDLSNADVYFTSFLTSLKWSLLAGLLIIIVGALIALGVKSFAKSH